MKFLNPSYQVGIRSSCVAARSECKSYMAFHASDNTPIIDKTVGSDSFLFAGGHFVTQCRLDTGLHFNLALAEEALHREASDHRIAQPPALARTGIVQPFVVDGNLTEAIVPVDGVPPLPVNYGSANYARRFTERQSSQSRYCQRSTPAH